MSSPLSKLTKLAKGYSLSVFVKHRAIFFSFPAPGAPYRGRAHWKDLAVFRSKKNSTRKKSKNMFKFYFFQKYFFAVVLKNVFASKLEQFSRFFFSFLALGAPYRGRAH